MPELRLSHIEKLNESLIIQELTTPPQPKYNRLTISDPRPASSSTGALAPTDSVSSAILNKQIGMMSAQMMNNLILTYLLIYTAEWCSESRHRRTADASITFSRLCPPAEALRVLVNQSVATRCSDLSASPKARTIQNQSKIAAFGASESTALSGSVVSDLLSSDFCGSFLALFTDSAIPPEVQEKLYHFDRTCQFQIKRFWDCMMRPLTSPQNFERARVIDSSLGVLAEEIQQYRAELNTSRRQEFSRHFKSVSDKIDRSIIECKNSESRQLEHRAIT
jgi:hypothetical protein